MNPEKEPYNMDLYELEEEMKEFQNYLMQVENTSLDPKERRMLVVMFELLIRLSEIHDGNIRAGAMPTDHYDNLEFENAASSAVGERL